MPDGDEPSEPIDPAAAATRQEFAAALTRLRERAGYTVRDLARAADVPHSTVGGYLSGRHLPTVGQQDQLRRVLAACGVTDDEAAARWCRALDRVRRSPGPRPAGAPAPYRGLACFEPDDAEWFFGREELTRAVIDALNQGRAAGRGAVVVVGPSGSGKSSLLRAGVVAALDNGALAGGSNPPVLLFTPGAEPLVSLAAELATATGSAAEEIIADLRTDPARLAAWARRADGFSAPVLVIDQLEELFTECQDDDERQVFLAALRAATEAPAGGSGPPVTVLLGLRADFYHHGLCEPLLVPLLQRAQVAVGPMTEPELRAAITGPARKAGLDVEDGLVEVLLRDLAPPVRGDGPGGAHEAGALPLLSHALRATWERSRQGRLTVADYRATGGISGGVARTADAVVESLSDRERALARRLFVRLVRVAEDAPNTRRRASFDELEALVPDRAAGEEDDPDIDTLGRVLDRFVAQRLITMSADAVEITHEALVVAWPRLREWVEGDRRTLLLAQHLEDDARRWEHERRDPALLYRGSRLTAAREWAGTGGDAALTAVGRAFLQSSIGRERRRLRTLQQTVAALVVLLLVAISGGAYAGVQRSELQQQRVSADRERDLALSRMLAVRADRLRETDPALAMQLALAAYEVTDTVEARSSLLSASALPAATRMFGADGIVQAIAHRHDLLVGAGADGSVRLWDVARPHRPVALTDTLPGFAGVAHTVALDQSGRLLAVGGTEPEVYLYDVTRPDAPARLPTVPADSAMEIRALAFGPSGGVLAAAAQDATVRLWDVSDPAAPAPLADPLTGAREPLVSVAFAPDGGLLAAGGHDQVVHLWDVSDPAGPEALPDPLAGPAGAVFSVAFSPDGAELAATGTDQEVHLWDVAAALDEPPSPEPVDVLTGPTSWLHTVAYSPDGATVAAGSSDSLAWLWDRGTGQPVAKLPHPGPVTEVAFDPSGEAIYTGGADGQVRRWNHPGPVLVGAGQTVHDLAHHPDAALVAAASGDGGVYLWDVSDPQHPSQTAAPLTSPEEDSGLVGTVTISPDGRTVAASGLDGTTWRWNIDDPHRPTMMEPLTGLPTYAESLAFHPDSAMLAAGGADGTIALWDLTRTGQPEPLGEPFDGPTNYVYSVAFSPDGDILAAGGFNQVVWLWDVSDPANPRLLAEPLDGPTNFVYSVAFSPDGDTLAVGSADETVRLWDLTDPERPRRLATLTGPHGYVMWVDFDPRSRLLAAASTDHTVWVWDVSDPAAPQTYAVLSGATEALHGLAFSPDGSTLAAGGQDRTVRLWDTDPARASALVCTVVGEAVTADEWEQHAPGLAHRSPCLR